MLAQRCLTVSLAINRASSTEAYLLVYVDETELTRWEASDANSAATVPANLAPAIDAEAEKAQNDARDVQQRYGASNGVEGSDGTILTLSLIGVHCGGAFFRRDEILTQFERDKHLREFVAERWCIKNPQVRT